MATKGKSKCIYCGSTAYGRTCPYGPNKTHFHGDTDKCGWCGSTIHGPSCPFNPYSKYHQTGFAVTPMALEAAQDGIMRGLLMNRLSQPITEWKAYKIGLIDENGIKLREPENIIERNALTSVDRYVLRLKNVCKNTIDLVNSTLYTESTEDYSLDELKKFYSIELRCQDDAKKITEDVAQLVKKYSEEGLSHEKIEKILTECFLNNDKSI